MVQPGFCIARLRCEQHGSPLQSSFHQHRQFGIQDLSGLGLRRDVCTIRRNCVEKKPVDSARRLRSKSKTRQGHSRLALPRRTRPICFSPLPSHPVITRFTSSHGPRRSSAKTQRFCSADIIFRVSVVAVCIFDAVPSLPPCASGPNLSLRAKPPLGDI